MQGMVGGELQVLICMGGLAVNFGRKIAIQVASDLNIKERCFTLFFSFQSELNFVVDRVNIG